MRKVRSVLGILLIIAAITGLFFWEWKGRDAVMMDEVLVARDEIQKGTTVKGSMFLAKGVPKDNMLEGALTPEDADQLEGKISSQLIAENGQVIMEYFDEADFNLKKNESVFVIDPSWIIMRSSALRRGDVVDFYGSRGSELIGTYRIAYVKDASEREVRNAGVENDTGFGDSILERTDSTSVIDHIEIITTFRDYEKIAACVKGTDGTTPASLIIVQKGESQ